MTYPIQGRQSWKEKVLDADAIYAQISAELAENGLGLPKTSRRPDVRLILQNTTGMTLVFQNPGQHSDKAETIKEGEAAMVMLKGRTLTDQFDAARSLVAEFGLAAGGLTREFVAAISKEGKALDRVAEAYGPAPFGKQAEQIVDLVWTHGNGIVETITPQKTDVCAYGARAATQETAFRIKSVVTESVIYVKGTGTTPERMECEGMVIAVTQDWSTKEINTRPIVPSVAREFYGAGYQDLPVAEVHPDGFVEVIDLKRDGIVIDLRGDSKPQVAGTLCPRV